MGAKIAQNTPLLFAEFEEDFLHNIVYQSGGNAMCPEAGDALRDDRNQGRATAQQLFPLGSIGRAGTELSEFVG